MTEAPDDVRFMRAALAEARKGSLEGEVPVGAVVVSAGGKIIARGFNRPIAGHDPSAHAEVIALRKAARKLKTYRLPDCDLYVTLEPCAMCLGAAVQARVRKIVFGALDPKAGAVSSVMSFPFQRMNHRPEILGGILAEESSTLLSSFFRARRKPGAGKGRAGE